MSRQAGAQSHEYLFPSWGGGEGGRGDGEGVFGGGGEEEFARVEGASECWRGAGKQL